MFQVKTSTMDEGYAKIIDHLLTDSKFSSVVDIERKSERMREDFGVFVLKNPRTRIVINKSRKLSPYFLAAEALWIITQDSSVDLIAPLNKRMATFSDDGKTLFGAYGPRIGNQLFVAREILRKNLFSRNAVINIGRETDLVANTKDFPCNQVLQFTVRKVGEHSLPVLDLSVFIRSQDMLWGFPYDIFHWTLFQELMANSLGVGLGEYRHFMSNCHVYMRSEDQLRAIVNEYHQNSYDYSVRLTEMNSFESNLILGDPKLTTIANQYVDLVRDRKLPTSTGLEYPWNDFILIVGSKLDLCDIDSISDPVLQRLLKLWRNT